MQTTMREAEATGKLAGAVMEFVLAVEAGADERWRLRQREVSRAGPHGAASPMASVPPVVREVNPFLTTRQAAKFLAIGERTLWQMTAPRGSIPVVRFGTTNRFDVNDLRAAAQRLKVHPQGMPTS